MTVGTADQEGEIAPAHAPRRQLFGQGLARPGLAATIERDRVGVVRQGGEYRGTLVLDRTRVVAALAAQPGFQFDQLQRQLVRQSLAVFGEAFRHPAGHAFTDRDQARAHDPLS